MKKKLALAMSLVLLSGMFVPATSFAAQDKLMDPYSKIILNLNENEYGGVYIKDNVLHIKPLTENKKFNLPNNLDGVSVIYDTVATYSMKELSMAQKKAEALFEELELDFVGIDDVNNGLHVGVKVLTEDVKRRFETAVGITNIRYEEVGETIEDESLLPQTGNAELLVATEVSSGVSVSDIDQKDGGNLLYATIGASAWGSNNNYFVTTAHGTQRGDRFQYTKIIGTVADRVMSGRNGLDIALIGVDASNAKLSMKTIDNKIILASGAPVTGSSVKIIIGNTPVSAIVENASCTKSWSDPSHNDIQTYNNIMMMKPTNSSTPTNGNSGSAICTEFTSAGEKHYSLCGIYKGRSTTGTTTYLYATRWDTIEDYFDINLY